MSSILPMTTITELQRKPREVFEDVFSYKIVLSNNKEIGAIISLNFLKNLMQIAKEQQSNYSDFFIESIKQSEKDKKTGKIKSFDNTNDAIFFLDSL
ncbi:hypothetical protein A2335_02375 [Candidatus Peregrinibacteria bacterium RIFOXYB2_FULL_32_7]|nr:MAG: hypothetical protein A2335_02375 [Candidatus Peregrinibacteria bacterium RIFOXYB2_FULL_32_7]